MQGIGNEKTPVKTEWSSNPSARRAAEPEINNAPKVGQQLNEMTGATKPEDPYAVTKKKSLDKEAFLKMFMTQLKYQDPTSPVDNEKMAQQMAMFSQLEQSVTTNQYLEKMLAKQDDQSQLAFSMIGKTVSVDKAALFHTKLENSTFSFKLPQDVSELKVLIVDEAGETVKTLPMERRGEGDVKVRWDGSTDDGLVAQSGRYFYRVDAKDLGAAPVTIDAKVQGKVSGITRAGGQTFLLVGDQKISMNEVNSVRDDSIGAATAPAALGVAGVPSNPAQADKNLAGMKPVSNTEESGNKPEIAIDESVKKALNIADEDSGPRMNPLMPLFMR